MMVLLLIAALGSGTALADRQEGASGQVAFKNKAGASIVTNVMCAESRARGNPSQVTVWGSGWASKELILVSLVKGADDAQILFSGTVNAAGAFEILTQYATNPSSSQLSTVARYPGAGLFSLEALGTSGRLATAPVMFVLGKCAITTLDDVTSVPTLGSLALAMAHTAPFLDESAAVAAGYVSTVACVASSAGAMGIHYINLAAMADTIIDPRTPEALLYLPTADGPRLIGVEYSLAIGPPGGPVPADPPPAPTLFGQTFNGPMAGHAPEDPPHYDLHAHIWADNAGGVFADFNPGLSCPS